MDKVIYTDVSPVQTKLDMHMMKPIAPFFDTVTFGRSSYVEMTPKPTFFGTSPGLIVTLETHLMDAVPFESSVTAIEISGQDMKRVAQASEQSAEPTEALKAAVERYRDKSK